LLPSEAVVGNMGVKKSNDDSDCYREEANELYKSKQYLQALELYNKALCYAENIKSKEAAFCFANRSVVYKKINLPEASIENIHLARNAGYPAELMDRLNDREKKCQEMMEQPRKVNPAKDFFKLSYPAHKKTPFIANCIELRETKKYGRGLYATRDLKPGDIVVVFDFTFPSILGNAVYKRCTNCLEVNDMNLFPCSSCAGTMFCSKKCQDDATDKFHKFECPHIDVFRTVTMRYETNYYSELLTAFWRLLFTMQRVAGGIEKLKALCDDEQLTKKTFFDYDLSKDCKDLALNEFLSNLGKRSVIPWSGAVTDGSRTALQYVVDHHERFTPRMWQTEEEKKDILKIFSILPKITCNLITDDFKQGSINVFKTESGATRDIIAFGGDLPTYIFNNNCSPNVSIISINEKNVYVIIKPIKKNQQLFRAYT